MLFSVCQYGMWLGLIGWLAVCGRRRGRLLQERSHGWRSARLKLRMSSLRESNSPVGITVELAAPFYNGLPA